MDKVYILQMYLIIVGFIEEKIIDAMEMLYLILMLLLHLLHVLHIMTKWVLERYMIGNIHLKKMK